MEPAALQVIRSKTHCSVVAGPGAGKTELLAQLADYLLETGTCPYPRRILAISFKKDAARNLKKRIEKRCGAEVARRFDSFTFDAFAKGFLDRFLSSLPENWRPTKDYEILFPTRDMYNDLFRRLADRVESTRGKSSIWALAADTFERDYVVRQPLGPEWADRSSAGAWAAGQWWHEQLKEVRPSRISFPMIGRLVELILRTNPHIKTALRSTYSHVFMDEFQDTTNVQYDLVKEAFKGSTAVITAVGDHKQRIMGWANALSDAFCDFERDFNAVRVNLRWNHRSSPQLVAIQNCFARVLDSSAVEAESRVNATVTGDACAIWEYSSAEQEASSLAAFISAEIASNGFAPRDFALLVRQKANDYENVLSPVFEAHGVGLRNEAREIGRVALQDLLTETASRVVINLLRLCSRRRGGVFWRRCVDDLAEIYGLQSDDDTGLAKISTELTVFLQQLRSEMREIPTSLSSAQRLVNLVLEFLGCDRLRMVAPEYRQGRRFEDVIDAIGRHLLACCTGQGGSWTTCLDIYEGLNSVPLMTIHKSKGLEFHTVVFIGLDDAAWWSFRKDRGESLSGFFVSFTRAAQRAFYTYCPARGSRETIDEIYQLFNSCKVPFKR
jgi:superfamily I DNA/RNA helicase